MASESSLIAAVKAIFEGAPSSHDRVLVGIGDDAAIISQPKGKVALATDIAVEGVHFNRTWSSLFEIGAKITAANLADIYAMGGTPEYLLVAAALPAGFTVAEIEELARGIVDEASKVGARVVGGDLTASEALVVSLAVYGSVKDPILRSGAAVGDLVIISDLPGKSAAGLELLKAGISDERTLPHRRPLVDYTAARDFALAGVSAMCDVSDGLASELLHISRASGVGIEIRTDEAIDFDGGEDHVFVATISPHLPFPRQAIEIGRVVLGKGVRINGEPAIHKGFTHFPE
ncbi:MAG: thiamine-phosphate kinase [Actinomycetes bacterium]